jgi:hypothetical protein
MYSVAYVLNSSKVQYNFAIAIAVMIAVGLV